jgi:hypothetical protein
MLNKLIPAFLIAFSFSPVFAQTSQPNTDQSKFRQLGQELPTPNTYRTASGAPGHQYWQQKADYNISAELNDENQSIKGSETITYTNLSPDKLIYLWVQLDQNIFDKESITNLTKTGEIKDKMTFSAVEYMQQQGFDGGFKIESVKDAKTNKALKFTINKTMMRIDLPQTLNPKASYSFAIKWHHNINNQKKIGGRSGYEYFEADQNYLYEMAQWFPRMAVYDDVNGWQHKQFLGRGEFALPFGDYKVSLTVPSDHLVTATGVLQNSDQVLSSEMKNRLKKAETAKNPVLIVNQSEAEKNEKSRSTKKKTWTFAAKNVRDFAWASSRKFIWDAMGEKIDGKLVMAMSFYTKEGNPLWGKYSTEVVAQTLRTYSKFTTPYPYPVAISVHGPVGGMEYPMLCFNGGRPEADGTYSENTKYGMISVIIHEVGHNFFPMIINSDERQWSWMDEGLNTFCQYLTEQEWQRDFPSRRGEPGKIVDYMKSDKSTQEPIMTNSESIQQFGNNAYGKPATALNILRETVMGRELFDYAFKEYARRWRFKHPMPADFFRTMEDASGVDLDWFWRGWFYTTDHTDIALESVKWYTIDSKNPEVENAKKLTAQNSEPKTLSQQQNLKSIERTLVEQKPELKDFYNAYNPLETSASDKQRYLAYYNTLSPAEKGILDKGLHFYEVDFRNIGGLIMPLIVQMKFEDGTEETLRIPAEIWRMNNEKITKVFITEKPVVSFTLDPFLETADIDLSNNSFPRRLAPSRFELFKERNERGTNPMREQLKQQGSGAPAGSSAE